MASVRIFHKKQIRLDHLSFKQHEVFKIGNVGVATVKNRLAAALGPTDGPAKRLSKYYAIRKTRMGKGNRRNLMLTGDMLRNFLVRTVSEKTAKARNSTRLDRAKANTTNRIEPWIVFSPNNEKTVRAFAGRVLTEMAPRLVIERSLGGRQR
ncbi:MAG TPA: hypothetical protein VN442_15865 [Bryobacteraceae bacterium]|nr:hypothetical protein [Bryobacteraceae bacterium]